MKVFDWIRNIFFVLAVIIMLGGAACFVFHIKPAVVMSGSMEPTFHVGSVVFVHRGAEVKEGDPVAFYVGSNYVTHRIVEKGEAGWVTKGDNNDSVDPWQVSDEMLDGKVVFSIPVIGYVFHFATSKAGIIVIIALVLCLVMSMFMTGKEEAPPENTALISELTEKAGSLEARCKALEDEAEEASAREEALRREAAKANDELAALNEKLRAAAGLVKDLKDEKNDTDKALSGMKDRYVKLQARHFQVLEACVKRNVLTEAFVEKERKAYPKL